MAITTTAPSATSVLSKGDRLRVTDFCPSGAFVGWLTSDLPAHEAFKPKKNLTYAPINVLLVFLHLGFVHQFGSGWTPENF